MMAEAKEAKTEYFDAKRMAKHADWLAKSEAEKEEFATVSPDGDGVPPPSPQHTHTPSQCVHNPAKHSAKWNGCWPSGIIAEMLKSAGEEGVEPTRQMMETVFSCGMIPSD